jgi:hypothetical protein
MSINFTLFDLKNIKKKHYEKGRTREGENVFRVAIFHRFIGRDTVLIDANNGGVHRGREFERVLILAHNDIHGRGGGGKVATGMGRDRTLGCSVRHQVA